MLFGNPDNFAFLKLPLYRGCAHIFWNSPLLPAKSITSSLAKRVVVTCLVCVMVSTVSLVCCPFLFSFLCPSVQNMVLLPLSRNAYVCTTWPEFLHSHESEWPEARLEDMVREIDDLEAKKVEMKVVAASVDDKIIGLVDEDESGGEDIIMKLLGLDSSWFKLKRSVAWIIRVKRCLLQKVRSRKSTSSDTPNQQPQRSSDKLALDVEDRHQSC